ncbi:tetratricopeptide repeat protein [Paraburkholderia heleia]|uniref:tetratricopeptide repeat protein n=1 Tax=Paraburkholderia heleia TaxID=634127 RepID=UPI002AB6068E|nr:tetratricopeptide repeat protein [Paraburkholderia heleia]
MKRATVHLVFAAVALACAGVAAYSAVRLQRAQRINEAVAAASAHQPQPKGEDHGHEAREVRLARAVALSKQGAYDAAAPLFEALMRDGAPDALRRAALFDLGNLYLREGIGHGAPGMIASAAMIEEAKSRYRVLLRDDPDDWDARYNLERALWLAPETRTGSDKPDITEQHDVKVHDPQSKDLP